MRKVDQKIKEEKLKIQQEVEKTSNTAKKRIQEKEKAFNNFNFSNGFNNRLSKIDIIILFT